MRLTTTLTGAEQVREVFARIARAPRLAYAAGQVSGNLNDTAENIMHRRGDRPANLALSVGVAG